MFIDAYLGTVTIFAGNFAPQAWMFCQGQLLSIAEYDTLYSLIGNTYGGDGISTFALPDLCGRVAVHPGQSGGLSRISLGEKGGVETTSVRDVNLGPHVHPLLTLTGKLSCSTTAGDKNLPTADVPATTSNINTYNSSGGAASMGSTTCRTNTIAAGGSGTAFGIVSPVLAMNYIICVEGIFPSGS